MDFDHITDRTKCSFDSFTQTDLNKSLDSSVFVIDSPDHSNSDKGISNNYSCIHYSTISTIIYREYDE